MSPWIKSTAKIIFDPVRPGIKKQRAGSLIVADVDYGLAEYYRWWVFRRHGLFLHHTAFRPHVTIVDGKVPININSVKGDFDRKIVPIEYSVEIEQHWKFWVLPVRSEALENVRKSLGLNPNYKFHITFGRME